MNKRKIITIIITLLIAVLIGVLAFFITGKILGTKKESESTITKAQYVQLFAEQLGLSEAKNVELPYDDVSEDDDEYAALCAAYQWGYLPEEESFNGKDAVTADYVAITAFRAMGERTIKIYVGKENATDEDLVKSALRYDIISEEEQKLTQEECVNILNAVGQLSVSELGLISCESLDYEVADGVEFLDIRDEDTIFWDYPDTSKAYTKDSYEVGSVIMASYEEMTFLKTVTSVSPLEADPTMWVLALEDADPLEVFEKFHADSEAQVDIDQMYEQLRQSEEFIGEAQLSESDLANLKNILSELENQELEEESEEAKAYKKQLDMLFASKENRVEVAVDSNTAVDVAPILRGSKESNGSSFDGVMIHFGDQLIDFVWLGDGKELMIHSGLSMKDMDFYLYVEDISFYIDVKTSFLSLDSFDYLMSMNIKPVLSYQKGIEKAMEIMFPVNWYLPGGVISIGFGSGINFSLTGSANLELNVPVGGTLHFDKNNGLSFLKAGDKIDVDVTGKIEAEVKAYPIIAVDLFGSVTVFDVEPFIGIYSCFEEVTREGGDMVCRDLYIMPTCGLMVSGSEKSKDSILHKILNLPAITYYVVSPYSNFDGEVPNDFWERVADKRKEWHWESREKSAYVKVPKCTYGESGEVEIDGNTVSWLDLLVEAYQKASQWALEKYNSWKSEHSTVGFTSSDDADVYRPILLYYREKIANGEFSTDPFDFGAESEETFGYALSDINGDGQVELVLGKVGSTADVPVYAIYTADANGNVWHVAKSEAYAVSTNQIYVVDKEGANERYILKVIEDENAKYTKMDNVETGDTYKVYGKISNETERMKQVYRYNPAADEVDELGEYQPVQFIFKPLAEYGEKGTFAPENVVMLYKDLVGFATNITSTGEVTNPYTDETYITYTFESAYIEELLRVSEEEFAGMSLGSTWNEYTCVYEESNCYWFAEGSFDIANFTKHGVVCHWSGDDEIRALLVYKEADEHGNHRVSWTGDNASENTEYDARKPGMTSYENVTFMLKKDASIVYYTVRGSEGGIYRETGTAESYKDDMRIRGSAISYEIYGANDGSLSHMYNKEVD